MDSSKKTTVKLSKKNRFKGSLQGRIFLKINTEREFSKINTLDFSFLFVFLSRWINSNKFELIQLRKNMKNTFTLSALM